MLLSIAVPVYNEEEALPKFLTVVHEVMASSKHDHELILVDDGSVDGTKALLEHTASINPRAKVIFFSRNFGHQIAITAALDHASGDAVVVMDADLQDPPELLLQMLEKVEGGCDVISAQRITRKSDTVFKRATAKGFYWLMQKAMGQRLLPEVGDFRMFSRRAVIALSQLHERHRFMRGMVAWLGLKEAVIPFDRQSRVAGTTKYSTLKMLRFAWTAISSFSALPLRLSMYFGFAVTVGGFAYALYSIYAAYVLSATVPGWTSLIVLNVIFSGAILIAIGLVGDYLARVYEETKGRPLYVVSDSINVPIMRPANGVVLPPRPSKEVAYARSARQASRV